MQYLFSLSLGYLLGCSSMAYYIGCWKKKDIRTAGTGNLGASNATVLFGWGAGVAVAVHDIAKAFVAVWLAGLLFPQVVHAGAAAGVACVYGHIFPFYLKFKGGKGLASYFGLVLALNWKLAVLVAIVMVAITVISDFISLAAIVAVVVVPVCVYLIYHDLYLTLIVCAASVLMLYKHRENIVRIANGQEIGLRSTAKGEKRIDK
ncbi:MAG: glycerol-3-phosphate 1-O-acyltransferase PlsY [Oscillospiraceae bacterium]|nr:glycerol-3-phosphate 1-O-acyltransferase PlsY [Oscillospiraceae bacterium]